MPTCPYCCPLPSSECDYPRIVAPGGFAAPCGHAWHRLRSHRTLKPPRSRHASASSRRNQNCRAPIPRRGIPWSLGFEMTWPLVQESRFESWHTGVFRKPTKPTRRDDAGKAHVATALACCRRQFIACQLPTLNPYRSRPHIRYASSA
jgi:hypothetical protein